MPSESAKQKKQQQNHQQPKQADGAQTSSLTRLSKIPMIELSVVLTLSVYSKVKSSSELLNNLLNNGERLASNVLDTLKPLANRFQKQIEMADSLGNNVLDKLQATVPSVISYQPKATYDNVSNRLASWRTAVVEQLNVVRNFNLNKTASGALKYVDSLVDGYLPGADDEVVNEGAKDQEASLTGQSLAIVGKLRRRTLKRVQNVQRLVF